MEINDPLGFRFISIFLRFNEQKRWRDTLSRVQIEQKMKRHLCFAVETSLDRKFW